LINKTKKEKIVKDYAICNVACAPVRADATDKAEMVTQLLFGETCKILQRKRHNWIKIKCSYDEYEGWMDPKQIIQITKKEFEKLTKSTDYVLDSFAQIGNYDSNINILFGSNLPNYDGMSFTMPSRKLVFNGTATNKDLSLNTVDHLTKLCHKYLNAPYLWGGKGIFGVDCSGFSQTIFKVLGYKLPRDASQQALEGELIDFVELAKVGDLAFFINDEGKVIHVGIVIGEREIIHACGSVRIDMLDHEGIYNRETKKYSHKLFQIRRITNF
jgi:gamma-D-glutamyl-L-lysine dipeptidyl-peptidase